MANNMISKDLGPATAYAIAVENGYTGTEEQWASEIANASNNAQIASQKASDAEAYAAGTRGGEAVSSDDPAYQNNAEYYSGEAADSAEAAAGSATSAAESAATASAAYNVNLLAPNYSSSNTYAVGDHVIYDGGYYECISAISTAEAWTAAHWRQVTVGAEAADLKSAFDAVTRTGKITITTYKQGLPTNPTYTTRCNSGYIKCYPGDKIEITGNVSGQKYALASSSGYDSGWKTDNFTYIVTTESNYYVSVAKANATDSISPSDITTLKAEFFDKSSIVYTNKTDVENISDECRNMSNGILSEDYYRITQNETVSGYTFDTNGAALEDANYKLLKYAVTAGIDVHVWSYDANIMMQFQTDKSVPDTTNPYIVNEPISNGYCGKLAVPISAKWLIISVKADDLLTGIYFYERGLMDITSEATSYQLKSKMTEGKYYINPKLEVGGLNEAQNGAIMDVTNRLRSSDFLYSIKPELKVDLPSGIDWFVCEYDSTYTLRRNPQTWMDGTTYSLLYPYFKIVLRKHNDNNISTTDAANFKIYADIQNGEPFSIFEKVTPFAITKGWRLKSDGCATQDQDYSLYKFLVDEQSEIYINSVHFYQFQNDSDVPLSNNQSIVGDVVQGTVYAKVDIPTGATWLIVSVKNSNSYTGIYINKLYKSDHNQTMSVSPVLMTARYTGHRGGGKTAPENTVASCQQGYENGFRIVEIDIQFTKDNIPVVLHDATINRTGRNADGTQISETISIDSITYEESQEYDFGIYKSQEYAGTKLPKFDDIILWAKKNGCCIDCDLYGTENMSVSKAKIIYDLLTERGMNGSVLLTGGYDTLLLFNGMENVCLCYSTLDENEANAQKASTLLQKSIYTMCSVMYPYLVSGGQVGYCHKHGMAAKGFTVTTKAIADAVWGAGVDKMCLDGIYPSEVE